MSRDGSYCPGLPPGYGGVAISCPPESGARPRSRWRTTAASPRPPGNPVRSAAPTEHASRCLCQSTSGAVAGAATGVTCAEGAAQEPRARLPFLRAANSPLDATPPAGFAVGTDLWRRRHRGSAHDPLLYGEHQARAARTVQVGSGCHARVERAPRGGRRRCWLAEGETHAKRGRHSPAPLSEGVDSRLLDEAEAACSMSPPAQ